MPVTTVTILSITPDDVHAVVHWQANTTAVTAEARVAASQADLANPAKRTVVAGIVPDIDFQVDIPDINNGQTPLTPGTTYWCQCMADGVLSAAQSFQTTGQAPVPPGPVALGPGKPSFSKAVNNNANGRQLVKIYRGSLFMMERMLYVALWNGVTSCAPYGDQWYPTSVDTDGLLKIDISGPGQFQDGK